MKIIDADLFCGSWPFNEHGGGTLSSLARRMDSAGIDKGFISSFSGFFERENLLPNRKLLRKTRPHRQRLIPVLSVNPELSSSGDVLRMAVDCGCALKLLYRFHGYSFSGIKCRRFLERLEREGMPVMVQLRFYEERTRSVVLRKFPAVSEDELTEVAASHPGVDFIFSCPKTHEASRLMERDPGNVYFTSSFLEGEVFLENFFRRFSKRVIFGSNFPVFSMEPGVAKLSLTDIPPKDRGYIARENILRLFPAFF